MVYISLYGGGGILRDQVLMNAFISEKKMREFCFAIHGASTRSNGIIHISQCRFGPCNLVHVLTHTGKFGVKEIGEEVLVY